MRDTQYATALPTRTTLRHAAAQFADAVVDYAVHLAVVSVAAATFLAAAAALVIALATTVVALPAHPLGLLATVAVTTVALYTLPLVALRAAVRVADATAAR